MGSDNLQRIEGSWQPRRQAVRQQAEGCLALWAVPASHAHPARRLARIGAMPCERASTLRMVGTPFEFGAAPRVGSRVLLAGERRGMAKLHRPGDSTEDSVRAIICLNKNRDYDYVVRTNSGKIPYVSAGCSDLLQSGGFFLLPCRSSQATQFSTFFLVTTPVSHVVLRIHNLICLKPHRAHDISRAVRSVILFEQGILVDLDRMKLTF